MNLAVIPAYNNTSLIAKPLCVFSIDAANAAKTIDKIVVVTNNDRISEIVESLGGIDVVRAGPGVDAIKKAVEAQEDVGVVAVVNGDSVFPEPAFVDQVVTELQKHYDPRPERRYTGVMSVYDAGDAHPRIALEVGNKYLKIPKFTKASSERPLYYWDGEIYAFWGEAIENEDGPSFAPMVGKRCFPLVREWSTSKVIRSRHDQGLAKAYLKAGRAFE